MNETLISLLEEHGWQQKDETERSGGKRVEGSVVGNREPLDSVKSREEEMKPQMKGIWIKSSRFSGWVCRL